jgi:hypothetical protein
MTIDIGVTAQQRIEDPAAIKGGQVDFTIENDESYKTHTFTSSGELVVEKTTVVDVLVVAGGGGGGSDNGGGGGAGGLIYRNGYSQLTPGTYSVVVGAGGAGAPVAAGTTTGEPGSNGGNSEIAVIPDGYYDTGGSVGFDGATGFLSISDNPALRIGLQDFTIEAWVYLNNYRLFNPIAVKNGATSPEGWFFATVPTSWLPQKLLSPINTAPSRLEFGSNGEKMYVVENNSVYQYDLGITWEIATANHLPQFSILAQSTTPSGIYFTPDGAGLYMIETTTDSVHQYVVNTPWSVKSAVYVRSFSVATQEITPSGISFKPDGTKMYIVGSSGDDINEYTLSTPWDIGTAVYVQVFSVAAQDTVPEDIFIRDDGLKMYVIGSTNDSVYEYNISTPWNIATASFVRSFSVATQEILPQAISFKPDGTKMYIVGSSGDDINEYTLSTPWDISTSVYVQVFSIAAQEGTPQAFFFKSDGTKIYVLGLATDTIHEYELSTAWDVSTAARIIPVIDISAQDSNMSGITFNNDGTRMFAFAAGNNSQSIYEYNLSTPWNVRTAVYSQTYLTDLSLTTIKFNDTGDKLYVLSEFDASVTEYSLENSWDISAVTLSSTYNLFDYEQYPVDIKFKSDGTEFFIVGRSRNITSYSLSAAWDISTATFSDRRDISTYNIPSGLGVSDSGDKLYILDQPTNTVYQHDLSENWNIMSELGLLGRLCWDFQNFIQFSTASVDLKSWTHVAVARSNGTLKFFINGDVAGEFADTNDYASASDVRIGRGRGASINYFNGSISNFRFILGEGIYRSNFTPLTSPLSSTRMTSLLALNSKTGIADTSANNFTITVTGSATPSALSPFFSPNQTAKLISYGGGGGNSGQNAIAARSGGQAGGSGGGAQGEAPWLNYNVGAAGEALQPSRPGYMSNSFNALSRLVIANNNLFNFDSNIDYTVETWIYLEGDSPLNAANLRRACIISGVADAAGSTNSFEFLVDGTSAVTGTGLVIALRNGSTTLVTYTFPATLEKFKWHHVAFSKINATMQVYLNGVRIQLVNDFTMRTSPGPNPIKIGSVFATGTTFQPLIGKLSNLRVSRGIGRYNNSEFSLATAPFTNDEYTILLTCQGESFKDASNNQLTIAREGDVRAVNSNTPFVRKKLFSGIFRDNGYLRADFALASFISTSQPWTMECWINPVSQSALAYFIGINSIAAGANTLIVRADAVIIGATTYTYSESFTAGEWAHFAMTYTGTVLTVYKNGQIVLNQTVSIAALYLSVLGIGAEFDAADGGTPGDYFNGYLHDFRIVKSVVYTDNFTPPTTLLEDIPGTTLLLLRGDRLVDESSANIVVTNFNNIRLENFSPYNDEFVPTTYSSFVPTVDYGSIEFDGSTSYIDAASNFAIGTNDFTIEFWCKFTVTGLDSSTSRRLFSQGVNAATAVQVYVNAATVTINGKSNLAGSINLFTTADVIGTVRRVNDGQWHHIAFTREGTVLRSFVDGQLMDSIANNTTNFSSISGYRIGTYAGGATLGNYNGKLANLRLAVFKAFYTDNFTPLLDNVDTSLATEDFLIETKLLIQGQTIFDQGPNNYALTIAGNTAVSEDSAFLPVQTVSSLVNPAIKSYGNKGGFALVGTTQQGGAGGGGAGEPGNNSVSDVGGSGGDGMYILTFDSAYAGGGGGGNLDGTVTIVPGGSGGGGNGSGFPFEDNSVITTSEVAVGGTTSVIEQSGQLYRVHVFNSSDVFRVNTVLSVEYLIVAGGGGAGGVSHDGGGGAGGMLTGVTTLEADNTYFVAIGAGGPGSANGGSSRFANITAVGGGRGDIGNNASATAGNGGSGGGAGLYAVDSGNQGTGIPGQGFAGGAAGMYTTSGTVRGGGGGGADAPGIAGNADVSIRGFGGSGRLSTITGTSTYYAGGGGGASWQSSTAGVALGGQGGGGNGGRQDSTLAQSGQTNTGGGAGARYQQVTNGGSGVVIVKYAIPENEELNNFTYTISVPQINGLSNTGGGGGGSTGPVLGGSGGSGVVKIKYKSAKPIAVKNSDITSNSNIDINLQPVSAQGPSTYSYSINPALPNGLVFNLSTGFITGKTTEIIDKNYTVTIIDETDVQLRDSNTFRLVVDDFTDVNFSPLTTLIEDDKIFNIIKITESSEIAFNKVGIIDYYAVGGGGAGGGGDGTGDACGGGGGGGYIVGRAVLTPDIFTPTIIYADSAFANQGWDTTTDFTGTSGQVKFIKSVSAENNQILQGGARTVELPPTRGYLEIKINEHANVNVGVCKSSSDGGLANSTSIDLETGAVIDEEFKDNSENNFTIVKNGDVRFDRNSPYSTLSSSAYFDGAGDYVSTTVPVVNATGDWTIEGFVYPINIGTTRQEIFYHTSPSTVEEGRLIININTTGTLQGFVGGTGSPGTSISNTVLSTGNWYHFAYVRYNNQFSLYINGVQEGSQPTSTISIAQFPAIIGYNPTQSPVTYFNGNISNIRVVNGTAVYTANFTPPTEPLTAIENTVLLTLQDLNFVSSGATLSRFRKNDILQILYDYYDNKVYFGKNNTWNKNYLTFEGDPAPGTSGNLQVIVMSNQDDAAESILDAVFLKDQDYVFSAPERYVPLGGKIVTIPVTIGAGGAGVVAIGNNGGDTTLFGQVALGGGGGGAFNVAGRDGGNGGGGGGRNTSPGGTGLQLISSTLVGSNGGAAAPATVAGTNAGGGGGGIPAAKFNSQVAFGGETTVIQQGDVFYRVHVFKSSATFEARVDLSIEYLVVAGGGAGGAATSNAGGGGGGAGGAISTSTTLTGGLIYAISVGGGGTGVIGNLGNNGSNTIISGPNLTTITAIGGGGGGGGSSTDSTNVDGGSGGSGGGGSGDSTSSTPLIANGLGTPGQGNDGGAGGNGTSGNQAGGGGGGAGAAGSASISNAAGDGGIGVLNSISGTSTYYAGGGGGAQNTVVGSTAGTGGLGGGGDGSDIGINGRPGTPSTGGGGGGAGRGSPLGSTTGGSGGSGIVIIKYQIPDDEALNSFEYVNVAQFSPGADASLGGGGAGGNGIALFDNIVYGAGGGASGQTTSGQGGNATAGDGAINIGLVGAGSGDTNTGSGGGGSFASTTNGGFGGSGGSGVAFIKYRIR